VKIKLVGLVLVVITLVMIAGSVDAKGVEQEVTNTPVPPTNTPELPTETPLPPTSTPDVPTNTPDVPTNTLEPVTETPLPDTPTVPSPTNTPVPPTNTPDVPTFTPTPDGGGGPGGFTLTLAHAYYAAIMFGAAVRSRGLGISVCAAVAMMAVGNNVDAQNFIMFLYVPFYLLANFRGE